MKDIAASTSSVRPPSSALDNARAPGARTGGKDSGFLEQLTALQDTGGGNSPGVAPVASTLKFSNHAVDRMQARGIRFSPEEMAKIEGAVSKAAAKGAKETLLLTDQNALIVSIKDNTVVTVMDKAALKDNVFTKIDSTVVI